MSKYIGSSAVNLSTTSADVTGNADIDGNLTVGGNLTVSGTTITVDHATAQTVDLGDGDKIRLGDDNDLQIYHTSQHSIIEDNGTGAIKVKVGDFRVENASGNNLIKGVGDVASLYHAGSEKIATTSFGAQVTGSLATDTITNATANTDITIDTNFDIILDPGGRVGIGTSSPTAGFRTSIKGDYSSIIGGIELDSGGGDKFTIGHASATSPSGKLNVVGAGNLIMATNNTERMRIDSSGNLLHSKTSSDGAVQGHELRFNNFAIHTVDNGPALIARRIGAGTNDYGNIQMFQNNDGDVGSIGTPFNNELYITASGSNSSGILLTSANQVRPMKNGSASDSTQDLGAGNGKWKDLYLSGGVYLGGTGSANKLDDYETGTWSPSILAASTNPTVTYTTRLGAYVIVGNTVYISFYIYCAAGNVTGGVGTIQIGNLPAAIQPNGGYSNYGLPFILAGYVHTGGASQAAQAGNTMRWQANAAPASKINLYSTNSNSHGTGAWELSGSGTFPLA